MPKIPIVQKWLVWLKLIFCHSCHWEAPPWRSKRSDMTSLAQITQNCHLPEQKQEQKDQPCKNDWLIFFDVWHWEETVKYTHMFLPAGCALASCRNGLISYEHNYFQFVSTSCYICKGTPGFEPGTCWSAVSRPNHWAMHPVDDLLRCWFQWDKILTNTVSLISIHLLLESNI